MAEKKFINAEQMKGDIRIAMAEQLHKDPFNLLPKHLAKLLCQFVDDTDAADVVCRNDIIEAFDAYISEMTVSKYGTKKECEEARWAVKTAVRFVLGERKEQT